MQSCTYPLPSSSQLKYLAKLNYSITNGIFIQSMYRTISITTRITHNGLMHSFSLFSSIPQSGCISVCNQLSTEGLIGCFQFAGVMNPATIIILAHVSWGRHAKGIYMCVYALSCFSHVRPFVSL